MVLPSCYLYNAVVLAFFYRCFSNLSPVLRTLPRLESLLVYPKVDILTISPTLQKMKPTVLSLQQLRFLTLIESELLHYLTYIMDQVDIYSNKERERDKGKKREALRTYSQFQPALESPVCTVQSVQQF